MTMSLFRAAVVAALVLIGNFFLLVGTVGLLRLPDVYNRMHATSKATTLGASSILLAGFVFFLPAGAALTSLVGILFLFLTAPTGAHLISRSAQKMGVPLALEATWPRDAPDVGTTNTEHDPERDRGSAGTDDEPTEANGEPGGADVTSSSGEVESTEAGQDSRGVDDESAETDEH